MNMKKRESFVFLFLSLVLMSLFFASSQYYSDVYRGSFTSNLAEGSYGAAEIISSLFGPFFGALLASPAELLFENILIFFIIFSIVFMVVQRMEVLRHNKAVVTIVSLSVSILAARFMDFEMIITILITYQTLGAVLTAILPLIIGFVFIQQFQSGTLRKIFWIFFTVVFFAMWDLRSYEAGPISWIYFWTAIVSLIFFIFDGTIRRALLKQKMVEQGINSNMEFSREVRRELRQLHDDHTQGIISDEEYRDLKRRYTRQLKDLAKF
jgi:hypothetical protein